MKNLKNLLTPKASLSFMLASGPALACSFTKSATVPTAFAALNL
jgi:hypothetical protein